METLSLLYAIGFGAFFILFFSCKPRGYYWGRMRGYEEGTNSVVKARDMIHQDIARAHNEMLIVSCAAADSHWDDKAVALIAKKATKENVQFTFLVGPRLANPALLQLAANLDKVMIKYLRSDPPFDLRIIDQSGTYTSNYGRTGIPRQYIRTFGSCRAVEDSNAIFQELLAQISCPVPAVDEEIVILIHNITEES